MTDQQLLAEFEALSLDEKMILALLALIGDATGRTAILDLMNKAGVRDARGFMFNVDTLDEPLRKLERLAFTTVVTARGYPATPSCAGRRSAPPSARTCWATCAPPTRH